jgi:hypothetical protein
MTKITISNQSHKSYRKYKSENGHTRTSEYIRGGIRCHGGVSIPVDRSHPPWALFPRSINGTTRSQDQCVKNGLTIGMNINMLNDFYLRHRRRQQAWGPPTCKNLKLKLCLKLKVFISPEILQKCRATKLSQSPLTWDEIWEKTQRVFNGIRGLILRKIHFHFVVYINYSV